MSSTAPSLDALGLKFGTDKSSAGHDYLSFYEAFFSRIRYDPIKLLEIGVASGDSLKVWHEYFPNAVVIGADIHPGVLARRTARVLTEVIDQSDIEELVQLGLRHGPFDVIVEDGSHMWEHQIITFKTLFPFLKTGGMYIAEDLHTNYGGLAAQFRGASEVSFVEYVKKLVDFRVADDETDVSGEGDPFLRTYGRNIRSLTFFKRACILTKEYRGTVHRIFAPGSESEDISDVSIAEDGVGGSVRLSIICHVGEIDDRQSDSGALTVLRGDVNIQGFIIYCNEALPAKLQYRARFASGDWTDWVNSGQFAGTIGQAQDLTGLAVRLLGPGQDPEAAREWVRNAYDMDVVGLFRGNTDAVIVGSGSACVSETKAAELYGIQVIIRHKEYAPGLRSEGSSKKDLAAGLHVLDPSRLVATSKFSDDSYASKTVLVAAVSDIRKLLPGRIWHDRVSRSQLEREFSEREVHFSDIVARTIEHPLLTRESILFDDERMYLDTSIELLSTPKLALPGVIERFREAIAGSLDIPVDQRYCDDTVLISHHEGGSTWEQYLIRTVPGMLLFLERFRSGKIAVPARHLDGATGFGEALEFYSIPKERLAPIEANVVYELKEAVLLDVLFNSERMALHPMALSLLRSFQPSQAAEPSGNRAAFIRPGGDSRRAIANEGAIEDVMARHGIEVFGPDELPLRKRVALWHGYDLLITTIGNDLTNMVYARPGTRVLVLSPDWFGESFFFELSMAAGVQWHELRCGEMVRGSEDEGLSGFHVDVDLLDSIVTSLLG